MTPQQVADIATAAIAYRIAEKAFWASLSIEAEERVILRDACLAAKHTLYAALDKAMADLTNTVRGGEWMKKQRKGIRWDYNGDGRYLKDRIKGSVKRYWRRWLRRHTEMEERHGGTLDDNGD